MNSSIATVDQKAIPAGANEEVAGPSHISTRPVSQQERISSIDVLRGFSLMGILIMNITSFALPHWNYMFPLTTVKPVFDGPHWKANTILWFARWVLAEGKMRALFSMLFGAGVILMTQRAEERGAGIRTAEIFTRRNMWLAIFGMLHCYLIWTGDILFFYGVTALLFLFPCRKLKPKTLLWAGTIILLLNSLVANGGAYFGGKAAKESAQAAIALQAQHKPITEKQKKAIEEWNQMQDRFRPSQKELYEDIALMQASYWSAQKYSAQGSFKMETTFFYMGFGDVLGMMLLGMGLFANGFFTAKLSMKTYAWCAIVALGIAWPVVFLGAWKAYKSHFDFLATNAATMFTYDLGRAGGAIGNAALLLLMIKGGIFKWLLRRIAAVGQMALSNYLLTSSSMKFLFVWGPLHWYGYMEYYKLYWVVLIVWIVNMTWSTIWLKYFRFGPAEWVWRSLTYWKRQPMKLAA